MKATEHRRFFKRRASFGSGQSLNEFVFSRDQWGLWHSAQQDPDAQWASVFSVNLVGRFTGPVMFRICGSLVYTCLFELEPSRPSCPFETNAFLLNQSGRV